MLNRSAPFMSAGLLMALSPALPLACTPSNHDVANSASSVSEQGLPQQEARARSAPTRRSDLHGLDPARSTSAPIATDPENKCLSDLGCPFRPTELPLCKPGSDQAEPVKQALTRPLGTSVVVWGELVVAPVKTLLKCASGCCNSAVGSISIHSGGAELPLRDDAHPHAFKCYGDDSRVCCGISPVRVHRREADATKTIVLVQGTLKRVQDGVTFLDQPLLCRR